jgi:hypothetical protein
VLPAVLAGALGFAAFLPLGRTGIGWFLAALAPAVGVGVVAHRSSVELSTPERIIRALWGVSALALLAVLTFRNAWWLVTFCVIGALGCAALAIVGGRSIRSMVFSTVAAPFAAFRSLPWVSRHTESLRRTDAKPGVGKRFGWSLVVTVVLLLVFGGLRRCRVLRTSGPLHPTHRWPGRVQVAVPVHHRCAGHRGRGLPRLGPA